MDAVSKGISLYRLFVDLPEDVTDDELRPLVERLLDDAGQAHVGMIAIVGTIANQIANEFPRAVLTAENGNIFAQAIIELARTPQP
jgi:hypothetical protein